MNSQEYVCLKISELINIFPNIKCSYEFDSFDDTHTVEIVPSFFFNKSKALYNNYIKIYNDFFKLYPTEGLYFIDDKSYVPVTNPIKIFIGNDYSVDINYNKANFIPRDIEPNEISITEKTNISKFFASPLPANFVEPKDIPNTEGIDPHESIDYPYFDLLNTFKPAIAA